MPGLLLTFTFNIFVLQVLIEAGSASSFELSPRFAANRRDLHDRGSREQIQDVESELHEAMSDAFDTEEVGSLLDGKYFISFMFFTFLKSLTFLSVSLLICLIRITDMKVITNNALQH